MAIGILSAIRARLLNNSDLSQETVRDTQTGALAVGQSAFTENSFTRSNEAQPVSGASTLRFDEEVEFEVENQDGEDSPDQVGTELDDVLTGNAQDNVLNGLGGNDQLFGLGGNDTLIGGEGDDFLEGGGGSDINDGGPGIDTASFADIGAPVTANLAEGFADYQAPNGNLIQDTLTDVENLLGSDNNDTLIGDEGDNIIEGGRGRDEIDGAGGNDTLLGGRGGDTLIGGEGDDFLQGGGGRDITDGGAGSDTVSFDDIGSSVTVNLLADTADYVAPNGRPVQDSVLNIENVLGSENIDVIIGDNEANVLDGNGGDDVIIALGGDDTLIGGLGDDVLVGGEGIDTADFSDQDVAVNVTLNGAGVGTATRETGFSVSVNNATVAPLGLNPNGSGDFFTEALEGNLYFNLHTSDFPGGEIRGQLDNLVSDVTESGFRTIVLDGPLDAAQEPGPLSDSEATGTGSLTVVQNLETGEVTYSSELSVSGLSEGDLQTPAPGAISAIHLHNAPRGENGPVAQDTLVDAGAEIDAAEPTGVSGLDVIFEVSESDVLVEIENVTGSNDGDTITVTGNTDNVLNGLDGNDVLSAGGGNDTIIGGAGSDTLIGGLGDDILDGGAGSDTVDFSDADVAVNVTLDGNGNGTATRETGFSVSVNNAPVAPLGLNPNGSGDFVTEALNGNLYFNVHTSDFLGGEIRGQLDSLVSDTTTHEYRTIVLEGTLDAAQEPGPLSDSEATGLGSVTILQNLETGEITYSSELSVTGLSQADLQTPAPGVLSAIHLHNAPRGFNGPVVQDTLVDAGAFIDANDPTGVSGADVIFEVVETDTLSQIENVIGSNDGDVITATGAANNTFSGLDGNDTLLGGGGNDTLLGGDGDDFLQGGGGSDITDGGDGIDTASFADIGAPVAAVLLADTAVYSAPNGNLVTDQLLNIENLLGSQNNDVLVGDFNNNELNGGGGNDVVVGLNGENVLIGGGGNDILIGGAGDDFIQGGGGSDVTIGGGGIDTVSFADIGAPVTVDLNAETASYLAPNGNLIVDTVRGFENVVGSANADTIIGDQNDNVLNGGAGDDILTGGAGADTFVFELGTGFDTITDFQNGIDRIDVGDFGPDFDVLGAVNGAQQDGDDTVITLSEQDSVRLANFDLQQLSDDDFVA